jgi:hypothetical protein
MPALLGTRALNVTVSWSYGFVGHGESVTTTPGVVYLDVGNRLCPGVLDQHHDVRLGGCTSELLVGHPEHVYHHLLGDLLRAHANGQLGANLTISPRIVTHRAPDWDGIVSAFLARRLIEDGELPAYTRALVAFSLRIDQGRFSVRRYLDAGEVGRTALSRLAQMGLLLLSNQRKGDGEMMRLGLVLIESLIADVLSVSPRPWEWTEETFETLTPDGGFFEAAGRWADRPEFAGVAEALRGDYDTWVEESRDADRIPVELPVERDDGRVELVAVPATCLRRPSRSVLNKYWARAEGTPLFVCPYVPSASGHAPIASGAVAPRVVISLPDDVGSWPDDMPRADLRGLGALLEREETRLRREQNKSRVGRPRWDDTAYCDNDDPWYDGRGHAWRILDTPRVGTVIPYDEVLRHLRDGRAWAPLDVLLDSLAVDLHVGLPDADENQRAPVCDAHPMPGEAWGPGGMSRTLATWRAHTRGRDVLVEIAQACPPPEGVRLERAIARVTSPPARGRGSIFAQVLKVVARRDPDASVAPRLGAVIDWVVRVERYISRLEPAADGDGGLDRALVTLTWSRAKESRGDDGLVERQLRRLGVQALDDHGFSVGGRAMLRELRPAAGRGAVVASHAVLAEMQAYVAFVEATLSRVSERIAAAVLSLDGSREHKRVVAADVRNDFLLFQGLYFQYEVSANARVQRSCERVREALQIDAHYREAESELDRLAQVETARADAHMNDLLNVLTLLSLVGTFDAIAQAFDSGFREGHWLRLGFSITSLIVVVAIRTRRRTASK